MRILLCNADSSGSISDGDDDHSIIVLLRKIIYKLVFCNTSQHHEGKPGNESFKFSIYQFDLAVNFHDLISVCCKRLNASFTAGQEIQNKEQLGLEAKS